jgi:hypothetical protein
MRESNADVGELLHESVDLILTVGGGERDA